MHHSGWNACSRYVLLSLDSLTAAFPRFFSDFPSDLLSVNAVLRLWQLMLSAMVRKPFRLLCHLPSLVFIFHTCNQSQSPVNMDYLSEMSVNPNCVSLELPFWYSFLDVTLKP